MLVVGHRPVLHPQFLILSNGKNFIHNDDPSNLILNLSMKDELLLNNTIAHQHTLKSSGTLSSSDRGSNPPSALGPPPAATANALSPGRSDIDQSD